MLLFFIVLIILFHLSIQFPVLSLLLRRLPEVYVYSERPRKGPTRAGYVLPGEKLVKLDNSAADATSEAVIVFITDT